MSIHYERFISFTHSTFYPLDRNTYQFDFKLHYLAYIIFLCLSYLNIYFLNYHCIPICFKPKYQCLRNIENFIFRSLLFILYSEKETK